MLLLHGLSAREGLHSEDAAAARIRLLVTSFNMGNAAPEGLENLVPLHGEGYDLITMGFQESRYSLKKGKEKEKESGSNNNTNNNNAKEGAVREISNSNKKTDDYVTHLLQTITDILGPDFYMVEHNKRAEMQMVIFARKAHQRHISHIEKSAENTGFLHVFPNKGGLCITLKYNATSLSFFSSHLAAHEGVKKCHIRNESIFEILNGIKGYDKRFDCSMQSHHTFFVGDMNYRVTFDRRTPADLDTASKKIPEEEAENLAAADDDAVPEDAPESSEQDREANFVKVFDAIEREDWTYLLQHDELNREIQSGRILNGFHALLPTFPPTFKRKRHQVILKHDFDRNLDGVARTKFNPLAHIGASSEVATVTNLALSSDSSEGKLSGAATTATTTTTDQASPPSTGRSSDLAILRRSKEYEIFADTRENQPEEKRTLTFYEKQRMPSFTDRILFRSLPGFANNISATSFESCEGVSSSDHKPVRATFSIKTTMGAHSIGVREDNSGNFSFQFSNLKGKDLAEMDSQAFGGGSDPYIIVHTDPRTLLIPEQSKLKSRTIIHDINPDWGEETLKVTIRTNDYTAIGENAHLFLSVWDYDRANADDLIGVIVFPFGPLLQSLRAGNPYHFNEQLLANGTIMGSISGVISPLGTLPEDFHSAQLRRTKTMTFGERNLSSLEEPQMGCGCIVT